MDFLCLPPTQETYTRRASFDGSCESGPGKGEFAFRVDGNPDIFGIFPFAARDTICQHGGFSSPLPDSGCKLGTDKNDNLIGISSNDCIDGKGGNDKIAGLAGND